MDMKIADIRFFANVHIIQTQHFFGILMSDEQSRRRHQKRAASEKKCRLLQFYLQMFGPYERETWKLLEKEKKNGFSIFFNVSIFFTCFDSHILNNCVKYIINWPLF